jgi:hypothetical protein
MNSPEWQKCQNPRSMLPYLKGKRTDRRKRLLAVGFCRRVQHLMESNRCRRLLEEAVRFGSIDETDPLSPDFLLAALEEVEHCAEGLVTAKQITSTSDDAKKLADVKGFYYSCYDASWGAIDHDLMASCEAAQAVHEASSPYLDVEQVAASAARAVYRAAGGEDNELFDPAESAAQCQLIRDLVHHPTRQMRIEASWRTPTVLGLARVSYDERLLPSRNLDPQRLAVLADALEETGCTDAEVLDHLRGAGPHLRGCWVIDLILNRQ